jgi:hypothetical protein
MNASVASSSFLDLALDTGSRPWDQVMKEYEDIVRSYPQIVE